MKLLWLSSLLLGGCALYPLDTELCNPSERTDCMTISTALSRELAAASIENERLEAALRLCNKYNHARSK